ncbi:MAG: flavodoxin family protein [Lautropia sp.]
MLKALGLNCSLKPSAEGSSTQRLLDDVGGDLKALDVAFETVHVAALNILPGVTSNEGPADDWPALRERVLDADILVLGSPIWLGQPSSVAKRVVERMDAFLSETDGHGRMPSFGRVAAVAVVGNEDGAHHVAAELFQALNDVGFTLAANASTYWVGEAMGGTDYQDLAQPPKGTADATAMMVRNAVHLANRLKGNPYPGPAD